MSFATLVKRVRAASSTSNVTSWNYQAPAPTADLDTAVTTGQRTIWLMVVTADGNPTITETNGTESWNKVGQVSNGTAVTSALFTLDSIAAWPAGSYPDFQVGSTASEQFSCVLYAYRITSGKVPQLLTATNSNGSSTNSDPAAVTNSSGAAQDVTVFVSRGGDSTVVASAAPTSYGNLSTQAGGGSNGASSNGADRQINIANAGTENPGVFTSASEQWACWTVGLYEYSSDPQIIGSPSASATTAASPTLSPITPIVPSASNSATTAANVTTTWPSPVTLVPSASASATTAASLTLSPITAITPSASNSAGTAANVLLGGVDITPSASASATTAASPTLTFSTPIAASASNSATTADSPLLLGVDIVPSASASATTAATVLLGGIDIVPSASASATTAASPTLAPKTPITPSASASATTAANVTISIVGGTALVPAASTSATYSGELYPNLIVDGGFAGAGWGFTTYGGTIAVTGGKLVATAGLGGARRFDVGAATSGKTYLVEFDIDSISSGAVLALYSNQLTADFTSAGTHGQYIVAGDNATYAELFFGTAMGDVPTTATVDNFSVRELGPVNFVFHSALEVQTAESQSFAANVTITPRWAATVQAAASASTAGSPTLSPQTPIVPSPAVSATTATFVSIFPKIIGSPGISATVAGSPTLAPKTPLVAQSAVSTSNAASPTITPRWSIFPNAANSASTSANIADLNHSFSINVLPGNELPVFYASLREHEQPVWPTSYVEL